jgi:hypothetical protein
MLTETVLERLFHQRETSAAGSSAGRKTPSRERDSANSPRQPLAHRPYHKAQVEKLFADLNRQLTRPPPARGDDMTAFAFTKGTVVARENSTDRLSYP